MYNKLLIVISYYLDRFLLLSYPPPPIWGGRVAFLPSLFLLLFSPLPQPNLGLAIFASYGQMTDQVSFVPTASSSSPKNNGNSSAVTSEISTPTV